MIVETNMNAFDYLVNIQASLNSAYRNNAISLKDWQILMQICIDLVTRIEECSNEKNS